MAKRAAGNIRAVEVNSTTVAGRGMNMVSTPGAGNNADTRANIRKSRMTGFIKEIAITPAADKAEMDLIPAANRKAATAGNTRNSKTKMKVSPPAAAALKAEKVSIPPEAAARSNSPAVAAAHRVGASGAISRANGSRGHPRVAEALRAAVARATVVARAAAPGKAVAVRLAEAKAIAANRDRPVAAAARLDESVMDMT
ncbi:MAG TPA: hypothetical protein VNT79_16460 [Phycisphaerae bacterium]|nr:hypothetical protein [Phycisphaerae bacterium]